MSIQWNHNRGKTQGSKTTWSVVRARSYSTNSNTSLSDENSRCRWRRGGGAAVWRAVSQQQLLLSGATRPADVLAVRVVEPQESQDGLSKPQSRHAPQRHLRTHQTHDQDMHVMGERFTSTDKKIKLQIETNDEKEWISYFQLLLIKNVLINVPLQPVTGCSQDDLRAGHHYVALLNTCVVTLDLIKSLRSGALMWQH